MFFLQFEARQSRGATYRLTLGLSLPQIASIVWLLSMLF